MNTNISANLFSGAVPGSNGSVKAASTNAKAVSDSRTAGNRGSKASNNFAKELTEASEIGTADMETVSESMDTPVDKAQAIKQDSAQEPVSMDSDKTPAKVQGDSESQGKLDNETDSMDTQKPEQYVAASVLPMAELASYFQVTAFTPVESQPKDVVLESQQVQPEQYSANAAENSAEAVAIPVESEAMPAVAESFTTTAAVAMQEQQLPAMTSAQEASRANQVNQAETEAKSQANVSDSSTEVAVKPETPDIAVSSSHAVRMASSGGVEALLKPIKPITSVEAVQNLQKGEAISNQQNLLEALPGSSLAVHMAVTSDNQQKAMTAIENISQSISDFSSQTGEVLTTMPSLTETESAAYEPSVLANSQAETVMAKESPVYVSQQDDVAQVLNSSQMEAASLVGQSTAISSRETASAKSDSYTVEDLNAIVGQTQIEELAPKASQMNNQGQQSQQNPQSQGFEASDGEMLQEQAVVLDNQGPAASRESSIKAQLMENAQPQAAAVRQDMQSPQGQAIEIPDGEAIAAMDAAEPAQVFGAGNMVMPASNGYPVNEPASVQNMQASQETRGDYNVPQQIVEQARLIRAGENTEMVIKLNPEHLGELTLRVSVNGDGGVTASFHTDSARVRAILETSMVQLRQDLNEQGLKVDSVEVHTGLTDGQLPEGQSQGYYQQQQQQVNTTKSDMKAFEEDAEKLSAEPQNNATQVIHDENGNQVASGVDYTV